MQAKPFMSSPQRMINKGCTTKTMLELVRSSALRRGRTDDTSVGFLLTKPIPTAHIPSTAIDGRTAVWNVRVGHHVVANHTCEPHLYVQYMQLANHWPTRHSALLCSTTPFLHTSIAHASGPNDQSRIDVPTNSWTMVRISSSPSTRSRSSLTRFGSQSKLPSACGLVYHLSGLSGSIFIS